MNIKTDALRTKLELICDKDFEELTHDDLDEVLEITLSNSDVGNNPTPIFFEDLIYLDNLEKLTIVGANLTVEDYAFILSRKKLKYLHFQDSRIEELVDIDRLSELESLLLIKTYAGGLDNIGTINNLKNVALVSHDLSNINYLENLSLNSLILSHTNIDNYESIYKLGNLEILAIDNTNIDDLDFLIDFKNLKELHIDMKQRENNKRVVNYLIGQGVKVYNEFMNVLGEEYDE